MKKTLLLIAICFIAFKASAQFETAKQIYESPKMKQIIGTHKMVAILPFISKISYKKPPKGFDAESNRQQEIKLGTSVQSSMYTYLLRKADAYSVSFQDVDKTNTLLRKYKMLDSMDVHTKDEVAKILGVDAVIFGTYEQQSTKTEAGALVSAALFGGFGGKTGEGAITIQIANATDGELVWRYTKRMNEGLGTSTDDVVERQMRKLSRNFPYSK